jgi:hypothetical protein
MIKTNYKKPPSKKTKFDYDDIDISLDLLIPKELQNALSSMGLTAYLISGKFI